MPTPSLGIGVAAAPTPTLAFSKGELADIQAEEGYTDQAFQRLLALHFFTPKAYQKLGVARLQALAKQGDAHAMVTLGEKYFEAALLHKNSGDEQPNAASLQQSRAMLQEALVAGNIRSAGLLAQTYLEAGDEEQGLAWLIYSQTLGDPASQDELKNMASEEEQAELQLAGLNRALHIEEQIKRARRTLGLAPLATDQ